MKLSIGTAWDESRDIIARDGRSMLIVAAALVMLPQTLNTMMNPASAMPSQDEVEASGSLLEFLLLLVTQVGTLSITAIALNRSETVGGAIALGLRRLLPVIGAALLFIIPLLLLLMALIVGSIGAIEPSQVSPEALAERVGPAAALGLIAWMILLLYCAIRFFLISPVAISETSNPVAILKRSWSLTSGHVLKLLGFLLLIGIVALVTIMAAGILVGVVIALIFGAPEPMNLSALFLGLLVGAINAVIVVIFATMVARIYAQLSAKPGVPEVEAA